MPAMPFHLEKGRVLMAIEDLLNNSALSATLTTAAGSLAQKNDVGAVLRTAATPQPVEFRDLIDDVTEKWFDPQAGYWIGYRGDHVEQVVGDAILFAMMTAWNWDGEPGTFPGEGGRTREIRLWWHCSQHWFDTWVTWEKADGPVTVLFASPPHTGGVVVTNLVKAVNDNQAIPLGTAGTPNPNRDMVLISMSKHVKPKDTTTGVSLSGDHSTPLGKWHDAGKLGRWSIPTAAGGSNPRSNW